VGMARLEQAHSVSIGIPVPLIQAAILIRGPGHGNCDTIPNTNRFIGETLLK